MVTLYHASPNKELEILEPRRTVSKDKYIGDYVFATSDKNLALMYLAPKGYGSIMNYHDGPPKILICADPKDIRSKDKGGAIYKVDASEFAESPQKDLTEFERASQKPVKPISKEVYASAFEALDQNGVEVEFIDQATFDHMTRNT